MSVAGINVNRSVAVKKNYFFSYLDSYFPFNFGSSLEKNEKRLSRVKRRTIA
jgi:hypothetical protein